MQKAISKSSLPRPRGFTFDPVNMVFVCEKRKEGGGSKMLMGKD